MTTTFRKVRETKNLNFNIFNRYYIVFGFSIWQIVDLGDDHKPGFNALHFIDTHYFSYSTTKKQYTLMFRFGKYDKSISCSGG